MRSRLREVSIVSLMVFSIWFQISSNAGVSLFPWISNFIVASLPTSLHQKMIQSLDSARSVSEYAGWFLGLSSKWVMFAPPNKENWKFEHLGGTGGTIRSVPTSFDFTNRSFLQRNLFDFREAKYELNTYGNVAWQRNLAAHLCNREPDLEWVELRVSWTPMIPFEEVKPDASLRERFEDMTLRTSLGRYDCPVLRG